MSINKSIEAWVREDDTLYVGFPEGKPPFTGIQATAAANETLLEWDYPIQLDYTEIRELREVMYVDPTWYSEESWPHHAVSEDKFPGWTEVWKVGLDDIETYREAQSA